MLNAGWQDGVGVAGRQPAGGPRRSEGFWQGSGARSEGCWPARRASGLGGVLAGGGGATYQERVEVGGASHLVVPPHPVQRTLADKEEVSRCGEERRVLQPRVPVAHCAPCFARAAVVLAGTLRLAHSACALGGQHAHLRPGNDSSLG